MLFLFSQPQADFLVKKIDKSPKTDYNFSILSRTLNKEGILNTIKAQLEKMNHQEKEIVAIYRRISSVIGMSESEFWVLYALFTIKGECTQQEISDFWFFPKQTVNTVITNLKKKGYVQLETIPGTRNKKNILLTEKGKDFGNKTVMLVYSAELKVLEKMEPEERIKCIEIMDKYIFYLNEEIDKLLQKELKKDKDVQ